MVATIATRDHILDSAAAVLLRDGAVCLTLEKVAREAGISKGGLLYHFSAKERLIQALIERMIHQFDQDLASHEQKELQEGPGSRTRAFVRTTLEGTWDRKSGLKPHGMQMFAALLAAITTDQTLLGPLRRRYACWQAELERDQISPARATVVRLAADGLWFAEMLGLAAFSALERGDILQELLKLTDTSDARKPRTARLRTRKATA